MLNKSIKFLIENKLIPILLLIVLTAWGIIHAPFNWNTGVLPNDPVAVDAIPDLGENQQIVSTSWEGRSPQDVEDQITYPLTSTLMGLPGVKTIRSSSMFGLSSVYIIFEEDIDFYWSRSRILEKLSALPDNVLPQGVNPTLGPDATGLGQLFWYTLEGRDKQGNTTGGWDLNELRSIQDYFVKFALNAASGVSEVSSIGGYVQQYQVDVDPKLMRQYGVELSQIVQAVKNTNREIGAQTLEINKVEYFVRGLGYVKSISDIENTVVGSKDFIPIRIKDLANVSLGPESRRGILDKEGAEVVGGVVVARYGANPMEVINNVKDKISQISSGMPTKELKDGRSSTLTIVPFYDRSQLIKETLHTLDQALTLEILVTILVIVVMVFNLRASILISGLLPVAVLMVFISMKLFHVEANVVALSGIAIAIGTMVDVGVILSENIIRHLEHAKHKIPINTLVYNATSEVSGAIITAVLTTIVSFLPVFTMVGTEGKLFKPLAFTKTMALTASILVALFLIPPFAAIIFKKRPWKPVLALIVNIVLGVIAFVGLFLGYWIALTLLGFVLLQILKQQHKISDSRFKKFLIGLTALTISTLLSYYWRPLGPDKNLVLNFLFVAVICFGLLGSFKLFSKYYTRILSWALAHKLLFLSLPLLIVTLGFLIMKNTGKEFMPSLDEGTFLLMPTAMPHAGIEENKRTLQQLDMAVAQLPEIQTVVGKAGRVNSALDPAPLSMFENIIQYRPEYKSDASLKRLRFKVDENGLFVLKNGKTIADGKTNENLPKIDAKDLILDQGGDFFRNWRPHIKSPDDIWDEIVQLTKLPGVTSAPKLQPIETRMIMLQTGMRAPMGIKVKGNNLREIEAFGLKLETILKGTKGVKKEAVFADRIIGKPYLIVNINRENLARYGITVETVQQTLEVAIGGKELSKTVEGRERYAIRVRYPRALRSGPWSLQDIYIPTADGSPIPLKELAEIRYEKGPQHIKSEDNFLVGYVLFDKKEGFAEMEVVNLAKQAIDHHVEQGEITIPNGISYEFTGTYENQIRAEKTLSFVIPLALVIIFLILYFQFKSATTSLIVFCGIAVAFGGGFILIWLYGQDWFMNFEFFGKNIRTLFQMHTVNLSVAVWVGFIALFGIATDDGVVMATYLKQTFQRNVPTTKTHIRASVIEAGQKRIRPCLMTSATTLLALLPVLTSTGRGSDIMIPMAIPSFGGMLIALVTLFVVPVLYCGIKELELKKQNSNPEKTPIS